MAALTQRDRDYPRPALPGVAALQGCAGSSGRVSTKTTRRGSPICMACNHRRRRARCLAPSAGRRSARRPRRTSPPPPILHATRAGSSSPSLELRDAVHALALKGDVADRQHFVDQQDVGLGVHGHRKRQPHLHARAVGALDCRTLSRLRRTPRSSRAARSACFRVRPFRMPREQGVLTAGQLGMEPRAQVQQRADRAVHVDPAGIGAARRRQSAEAASTCPSRSTPMMPTALPAPDREADVAKSPGALDRPHAPQALRHGLLDGARPIGVVAAKGLADVRDDDHGSHHNSSANRWLARRNHTTPTSRAIDRTRGQRQHARRRRPLSPDEHGAIRVDHGSHRVEPVQGLQTVAARCWPRRRSASGRRATAAPRAARAACRETRRGSCATG